MAAPTFVQEAESTFNNSTTPKSAPAAGGFDTLVGDVLVALMGGADGGLTAVVPTLTGETFTAQANLGTGGVSSRVDVRTAIIASAGTAEAVSLARSGSAMWFGGNVLTFRNSDGVGAVASASLSGAPSLGITTLQDNSAIAVINLDWAAVDGAVRTWRTVNGSLPVELSYFRDAVQWGVYIAYYADAGAAGAKTVGLSAPAGQTYTIAAIEVKGTAGGAPAALPPRRGRVILPRTTTPAGARFR